MQSGPKSSSYQLLLLSRPGTRNLQPLFIKSQQKFLQKRFRLSPHLKEVLQLVQSYTTMRCTLLQEVALDDPRNFPRKAKTLIERVKDLLKPNFGRRGTPSPSIRLVQDQRRAIHIPRKAPCMLEGPGPHLRDIVEFSFGPVN